MNNPAVPALVTGLLGLIAVIVTQRLARGAQREMTPAQTIADLRGEVAALRAEVAAARHESRQLQDYVHQLRDHISSDKPPPPPPWPEGLTT